MIQAKQRGGMGVAGIENMNNVNNLGGMTVIMLEDARGVMEGVVLSLSNRILAGATSGILEVGLEDKLEAATKRLAAIDEEIAGRKGEMS